MTVAPHRAGKLAHRSARAATGVLAAGFALAAGALTALAVDPDASPFFAVGATTVDRTPAWAREFAINTFATNDKNALYTGMAIIIVLLGIVAGLLERPRLPVGSAIIVVFGAVGVYAAVGRPPADGWWAVPSIVAAIAGVVALRLMQRTLWEQQPAVQKPAEKPAGEPFDASASDTATTGDGRAVAVMPRRAFFAAAGSVAVIAAAAWLGSQRLGAALRDVVADRAQLRLPFVRDRARPVPAGANVDGAASFITPNSDFYRIDTALQVPKLTTSQWQLKIHGMVDKERTIDWDELSKRTPFERLVTLTCVSNEVGGGLAGNATWIGYPIRDLIAELGVDPDADMLLSTSVDGFTVGTPLSALTDGRDAMLAVGMNGEPLPIEHGYPVRQVVPGLYGYVSATKWVVDWEFTRFDRATAYWTDRGWSPMGPIKTASRIDVPRDGASVAPGRVRVAGTAWAQHRGISAVQVRVDDGPWNNATLATEYSDDTWRQWYWDWDGAAPGDHTLQVRAADKTGKLQTSEEVGSVPDGATGWHTRDVVVS